MLGWDGSGVVSFLLIVYYINFERVTNGLFTIFQNRIGDLFFVLFLLTLVSTTIALTMVLKIGVLFLILGACVKRAQYPFNAWLLAAIRAPTPISSLVHSSTLVVAGVYILLQFRYCLCEYLNILKYLRLLTLIIRIFGLLNEADIKKLIAYSTIRHVGLILFMLSLELYKVVYFHLNVHAIFKSLMFICFGFTILHSYHAQDKRLVTYIRLSPIIKIIYYFACFCLIGLPFLSGFFSKDFIIEKAIEISVEMRNIVLLIIFLGVSIYYSFKLLYLYSPMFVLTFNETQIVGIIGVGGIIIVTIIIINVYITLVFSVTLELIIIKIVIYMFILCFLLLTLLTNLNFK
jgi:NADH-ubiquinone oxidoreductase chain 5